MLFSVALIDCCQSLIGAVLRRKQMNDTVRILGIAGSLRRESYNRSALRAAIDLVPEGARIETFELDEIPIFNQDHEQDPHPSVVELKQRIREADAILFVTPEHNYSIPAALKNAIDWGSRPYGDNAWNGKVGAVMGASPGVFGTARAQYHLRQMLVTLNMLAVNQPEVMIGRAHERFDEDGNLKDERTKEHIRELLQSLVNLSRTFKDSYNAAAEGAVRSQTLSPASVVNLEGLPSVSRGRTSF
jgi:chromate reductase